MPIRVHLPEKSSFDPEAIEAMSKVFVDVCTALHVLAGDKKGREAIAARIIDLARVGIVDPAVLLDRIALDVTIASRPVSAESRPRHKSVLAGARLNGAAVRPEGLIDSP